MRYTAFVVVVTVLVAGGILGAVVGLATHAPIIGGIGLTASGLGWIPFAEQASRYKQNIIR